MRNKYRDLKVERLVNKMLYLDGVISERKYKRVVKRLDKLLLEESKKNFTSTLT